MLIKTLLIITVLATPTTPEKTVKLRWTQGYEACLDYTKAARTLHGDKYAFSCVLSTKDTGLKEGETDAL